MLSDTKLNLSGDRFRAIYRITGDEEKARAIAQEICIEQTIEFPAEIIGKGDIKNIIGKIEFFEKVGYKTYEAAISYPAEIIGGEIPQLLNVLFGNISFKRGIRLERVEMPESLQEIFPGPRFGRVGIRKILDVPTRPILCSVLKPMGLSSESLAKIAYRLVLGGTDILKDDHGLADQEFAPFESRVRHVAQAVRKANKETGSKCIYMPNITAPSNKISSRALYAKNAGAGGLLIAPGITGIDVLRGLRDDDNIALPIMSHPAWLGSYVLEAQSGVSPYALFGQIPRMAGADAVIFPNYGGRFPLSREECSAIVKGTTDSMGVMKPTFPAPGGGVSLERIPDMRRTYGKDVIFIVGGDLHRHGPDLAESCRYFREMIEKI